MEPTQELIDEIFKERVLRAREMTVEQKFLAGFELFGDVCERMAAGIRHENPGADEETVQQFLCQRLNLLRRLEAST